MASQRKPITRDTVLASIEIARIREEAAWNNLCQALRGIDERQMHVWIDVYCERHDARKHAEKSLGQWDARTKKAGDRP